jgi:hypothetical protein
MKNQWININNKLPEIGEKVLIIKSVKGYRPSDIGVRRRENVEVFIDGQWESTDWGWYPGGSKGFTHWMELPKAPEETK